jgi:hypothetical protein
MTDFDTLERLARQLCERRHGTGSWERKHRKRAAYRDRAARELDKRKGLGFPDNFMAIFGFWRQR